MLAFANVIVVVVAAAATDSGFALMICRVYNWLGRVVVKDFMRNMRWSVQTSIRAPFFHFKVRFCCSGGS